MKIPLRYLPHRISTRPLLEVGSSVGGKYGPKSKPFEALVVDRRQKVRDQRAGSTTEGTEIIASTHIVTRLEHEVGPGSLVILWEGKPYARTAEIVAVGHNEHPDAPESAQFWAN